MKTLFGICFLSVAGYGGFQASKHISDEQWLRLLGIRARVETRIEEKERIVEVEREELGFAEEFEKQLGDFEVPELIARLVRSKECNRDRDCIRYEPTHMGIAAKLTKNESSQRMYASSLCPMQVMGWWAPRFGLTWEDLLRPKHCVQVSLSIQERCWKEAKGEGREKIRNFGLCYNGPKGFAYAEHLVKLAEQEAMKIVFGG